MLWVSKKVWFVCVLMIFAAAGQTLYAAGNREQNVSLTADNPLGFTDTIDTTFKTPGTWNFYLEARDRAGNIARVGPENIRIDPASDLPVVGIINPMPGMRVQGNLNLVGVAMDDDGIQSVYLTINRGIDGRGEELARVMAQGTDYWSYFLDTSDSSVWTDGFYTVTAWAVDINGLSGIAEEFPNGQRVHPRQHRLQTVVWNLDRRRPETTVTSHEAGALVSGNIRLRGTVWDGNGINSLRFFMEERADINTSPPTNVRVNRNRITGEYSWEISLNTRRLEDGPNVLWFEALDGNDTLGTQAHLLFVNNTGPQVNIVYPPEGSVVNGVFSIAGDASHPVGMRSVTWRAGNQSGEIELLPGNHWWSAEIDIRGQRLNNIDIEVRAKDVSGNVTTARRRYRVDAGADLPTVKLTEPVSGLRKGGDGLVVKGEVFDNDGVASIFYSLNGGEPVELPAMTGVFQFVVYGLQEGNNSIEVWAKDITGVIGNRTAVRGIVVPEAVVLPEIVSVSWGRAAARNFLTGMPISPMAIVHARTGLVTGFQPITMQLAFRAPAAPLSAYIQFEENAPVPVRFTGSRGLFTVSVPFPANLEDGLRRIGLSVTDRLGREAVRYEYVVVKTEREPERLVEYEFDEETGVYVPVELAPVPVEPPPFETAWVMANELEDGRFLISSQEETIMLVSSVPVAGASIAGGDLISVEVDEHGRVILRALGQGVTGNLTLNLALYDGSNQSIVFRVLADFSGPSMTLQNMTNFSWVQEAASVNFNLTSVSRVTALDFSIDMGVTWQPMRTAAQLNGFGAANVNQNITHTINIGELEDGTNSILIRAENDGGLYNVINFAVRKDTQAPRANLVMPIAEARVNGTIRMAFEIEEAGSVQSIVYNRPARPGFPAVTREVFNADNTELPRNPRFIEVLMDSLTMPLDNAMRFTFTDMAGNSGDVSGWEFVIDQEMDIPVAHIILPLEGETIITDFTVSGVAYDDDGIANVQWRLNNGPWTTIEVENGFRIPISLDTLTDNEHSITVIAEDIYGVRSPPVVRNFRVSLSEPAAAMVFPSHDAVIRDDIELRGTSFDRNGIQSVHVSVDNGNTFNAVRGNFGTASENVNWMYRFNTSVLEDGPHVVFIRVVDRFGITATYANMINVDNTPPEVVLESPADGLVTVRDIDLLGMAIDPNLQSVEIQVAGLHGQVIPAALRSRMIEPAVIVRERIPLAGLADGHYNIAVIATDRAGNVTRASRNFELARVTLVNRVEILYPLESEPVAGEFNLFGFAGGAEPADVVTLRVNGRDVMMSEVDSSGFFRFNLNAEYLNDGDNEVMVHSNFGGGAQVNSRNFTISYSSTGPWVVIDSFNFGDFAYDRPWLYGRAGYTLSEEQQYLLADRSVDRETRNALRAKTHAFTEISFDNGMTFRRTSGRHRDGDFRYRIESGDIREGEHYIIIRSTMRNGETAVTRMMVQVDQTPPVISLISPEGGQDYNTAITFSASASDDVELVSLTYHLRVGDRAFYAVPGFLQGLFFDFKIPPFMRMIGDNNLWPAFMTGATFMDFGFGLSFFDDNVKLSLTYGLMTQGLFEGMGGTELVRYGGHVLGFKLLANIYELPFRRFLGPDWEWLSATFAVGANFSLFDIAEQGYTQSGSRTWMSALLFQIEFPRVTLPNRTNFRTFSVFTEGQLWFVPTDVDAAQHNVPTVIPHIIMGFRMYIF